MTTTTATERYNVQKTFEEGQRVFIDAWYTTHGFRVNREVEGKAWDLVLTDTNGRTFKVEEKFRRDLRRDVAVEIVQDMVNGSPGWISTCRADQLHYVMANSNGFPEEIWIFQWPRFKEWILERLLTVATEGKSSKAGAGRPFNLFFSLTALEGKEWVTRYQVSVDPETLFERVEIQVSENGTVFPCRILVVRDGYLDHVKKLDLSDGYVVVTEEEKKDLIDDADLEIGNIFLLGRLKAGRRA